MASGAARLLRAAGLPVRVGGGARRVLERRNERAAAGRLVKEVARIDEDLRQSVRLHSGGRKGEDVERFSKLLTKSSLSF